jgi:hypothetical protein
MTKDEAIEQWVADLRKDGLYGSTVLRAAFGDGWERRGAVPPLPMQPVVKDEHGAVRFKANPIVRYLLDNGGINLSQIGMQDFTDEDRAQFAQLIGYSVSGYGELSYVSDESYDAASALVEKVLA